MIAARTWIVKEISRFGGAVVARSGRRKPLCAIVYDEMLARVKRLTPALSEVGTSEAQLLAREGLRQEA